MKKTILKKLAGLAIILLVGALLAGPSLAVDFVAIEGQWTPPGGSSLITMWGFAEDTGQECNSLPAWNVGPQLRATAGEPVTINLRNCLSEPVSIFIPGQGTALAPEYAGNRVTSFTAVAQPNGGTASYSWNNLKAGSYLYHSGRHMAKQVQMGFYGALIVDTVTAGVAYDGVVPVTYDNEVVIFYSEIDPLRHDPTPSAAYPNQYTPRYFLVNGQPYTPGVTNPIAIGAVGRRTLVRMLSACLDDLVPTLNGMHWDLIAEDGNRYPYAKKQYTALLPAMKTLDAIIVPGEEGTFAVFDRRLNLTNDGEAPGGMIVQLDVGSASAGDVIATLDNYSTNEDQILSIVAPGVLGNDDPGTGTLALSAALVSDVTHGVLNFNADGSFTYNPNLNYNGADSFTYRAGNDSGSAEAAVNITVIGVNDAPVADPNGPYTATVNTALTFDGSGSFDADGDALTYRWDFDYDGANFNVDGTGATPARTYTVTGTFTVALIVDDGTVDSAVATTTVEVTEVADQQPVAVDDFAQTTRNTSKVIYVLANDEDGTGASVDPALATLTVSQGTRGGTVTINLPENSVTYEPRRNFRGTETFTYSFTINGVSSNEATVTVNVVR
jgi:FtsP/CotA-like multicopper oxidase with cupredoxin domain